MITSNLTNEQRINDLSRSLNEEELNDILKIPIHNRPDKTLAPESNWEHINLNPIVFIDEGWLYPNTNLMQAKALKCKKRGNPKIIITEQFNNISNIEEFAYVYLLISGCWRSDEEMKANKNTWMEALEYHGIDFPDDDETNKYNRLLIMYMLNSSRYSEYEIAREISMMDENMEPYLLSIQDRLSYEQRRIIRRALDVIRDKNEIEHTIIYNLETMPDVINKYIRYSFDDASKNRASIKLSQMFNNLNEDQKYIFTEVKTRLEAGIQVQGFVSGRAGTGKTYLIEALINYFICNGIPHIICASTEE